MAGSREPLRVDSSNDLSLVAFKWQNSFDALLEAKYKDKQIAMHYEHSLKHWHSRMAKREALTQ